MISRRCAFRSLPPLAVGRVGVGGRPTGYAFDHDRLTQSSGCAHPNPRPARGRGVLVRAIPRGCAGPGGVAAGGCVPMSMSSRSVEAAPSAAARPRTRFSLGLVVSESPAEDAGLPASARPTNDTSMASTRNGRDHEHRYPARPHDASRQPPWSGGARWLWHGSKGVGISEGCGDCRWDRSYTLRPVRWSF